MDSSRVHLNTPYIVGKVLKSTKKEDKFQAQEIKQLGKNSELDLMLGSE